MARGGDEIQHAIDVSVDGDTIWVTNGVYATGGKVMSGDLTNRVALDKALTVRSVNGPGVTILEGAGGPGPVRSAWVGKGAILNGFTLLGGATASEGSQQSMQSGGGAWAESTNAVLVDCVITNCRANVWGGGCYGGTLQSCRIIGNSSAGWGGGAAEATLVSCFVQGNSALHGGGGVYNGSLLHCTVTQNTAPSGGGGTYGTAATNSIIYWNSSSPTQRKYENWFLTATPTPKFAYACTSPLPSGPGNLAVDPELLDFLHICMTSPARGAGNVLSGPGEDIDGEPWASPPSMGCDEVWEAGLVGPLSVSFYPRLSPITQGTRMALVGTVTGRASRVAWDYGDGSTETNHSYLAVNHTWTNPGNYAVTFTAYNAEYPDGVSASLPLQVLQLEPPLLLPTTVLDSAFNLSFQGQPGVTYFFDQATNLVAPAFWQQLGLVYSTGQVMQVPLPKGTNDNRFYRVRIP